MPSIESLFRYQIVSEVLARIESGQRQAEAVRDVADRIHHFAYYSRPRSVSKRTLYRWLATYQRLGFQGLEEKAGTTRPFSSKALSPELVSFFIKEKKKDQRASIPELIRRAREYGIVPSDLPLDRTTVYRVLKRRGVEVQYRRNKKRHDARRFAYPHRLDMVLCDGKHFRAGATRARRVVLFFLDDATRMGLHLVVGTSESSQLFLRGLHGLIEKFGLMGIIFLDRGPGFIASDSLTVLKNLQIKFVHGTAAYPEGHGKVERFNRDALAKVLRGLQGRADVDPSCKALELRLRHYLETQYNHRTHEGIGNQTPYQRFGSDPRPLRFPEHRESLRKKFEIFLTRLVSNDNVVSIDSVDYEVPRGHRGKKILLSKRLLDRGRIFFQHQDRLIELHGVDLAKNARSRRATNERPDEDDVQHPLPPSAADLAFDRDYSPVVDPDGGFHETQDKIQEDDTP